MKLEAVSDEHVYIYPKTVNQSVIVTSSEIADLQEVLLKTIQLEDVEELYRTHQFRKLVDILKGTITDTKLRY